VLEEPRKFISRNLKNWNKDDDEDFKGNEGDDRDCFELEEDGWDDEDEIFPYTSTTPETALVSLSRANKQFRMLTEPWLYKIIRMPMNGMSFHVIFQSRNAFLALDLIAQR
jgi:hypothetical protein